MNTEKQEEDEEWMFDLIDDFFLVVDKSTKRVSNQFPNCLSVNVKGFADPVDSKLLCTSELFDG